MISRGHICPLLEQQPHQLEPCISLESVMQWGLPIAVLLVHMCPLLQQQPHQQAPLLELLWALSAYQIELGALCCWPKEGEDDIVQVQRVNGVSDIAAECWVR